MEDIIPSLLTEGMNEAELCGKLYERMIELGYHGVARFGKLQTEMAVGQLGFGENSAYPTNPRRRRPPRRPGCPGAASG